MSPSKLHDIKPVTRKKINSSSKKTEIQSRAGTASSKSRHHIHRIRRAPKSSGSGVWFLVMFIIVGLFFGFSIIFSSAEISVTPQTKVISLETQLTAFKRNIPESILFDVFVMDDEIVQSIPSEFESEVNEVARGTVRIYNSHSENAQVLAVDTRLADSEGRIYKTLERVVIPGKKIIEGVEELGFIDVEIYASETGDSYNHHGSSLRLGVLGFQEANSPKFETIYAETLSPITGGFSGIQKTVSPETRNRIISDLKNELESILTSRAIAQIPENTFLVDNMKLFTNTEVFESFNEDTGLVDIGVTMSLSSVLFNKNSFEWYLISNYMNNVTQEDVHIANLELLNISYVDKEAQTVNLSQLESLVFTLDDSIDVVWNINKESLVFDLVGKRKKDFSDIIRKYPSIATADLKISPVWRWKMPEVGEDISIIIR